MLGKSATLKDMMDPEGGRVSGPPPPMKNHKHIGFLSNTGPDPLQNDKATKLAFNNGPLLTRQQNAIQMVFRWWANDGHLIVVFGSSIPLSTKKTLSK